MDGTQPFLAQLTDLFTRMAQAYDQAADGYGFQCNGCDENCCASEFYHHTLLEYLYLRDGLARLAQAEQQEIRHKARDVRHKTAQADRRESPLRIMCPLNREGRCRLYPYRPMICRMHGIPHHLRRPDGSRLIGPGCADFEARCDQGAGKPLDRTPFYHEMARLEQAIRRHTALGRKIKMTVADILVEDL